MPDLSELEVESRNPLARGVHPTLQWFRSIVLLLRGSGDDFSVSTDHLARWIYSFDEWFRHAVGINAGQRLHLLYRREVTCIGEGILRLPTRLAHLADASRGAGFGFSVTMPVQDAVDLPGELDRLLAHAKLTSIGLVFVRKQTRASMHELERTVEMLVQSGITLGLLGDVSFMRDVGILGNPEVCRSDITIYPMLETDGAGLPVPLAPDGPCFARFRIHVDDTGVMYPCLGMVGVRDASLGTVFDSMEMTPLGRSATTSLDLQTFARKGPPNKALAEPDRRLSTLPWICERHRLGMLNR